MIRDIINIATMAGFDLVPLIDHHALNEKLDEYVNTGQEGLFIMLPENKEKRQRTYDHISVNMIELVASSQTSLSNDDVTDFYNVNAAVESLEYKLEGLIKVLQDSGHFERVSRIRFKTYPYRYDSFQTVVTANFELTKPDISC